MLSLLGFSDTSSSYSSSKINTPLLTLSIPVNKTMNPNISVANPKLSSLISGPATALLLDLLVVYLICYGKSMLSVLFVWLRHEMWILMTKLFS
jgi:hypothetical protein